VAKLDESASVPAVGKSTRARLGASLERPGVVSALLFGSQATGRAGPLSDIDVAVWLDPGTRPADRYGLERQLMDIAAQAAGTDELELVVLNDAAPLLQYGVLRNGIRLVDREPRTRIQLETDALLKYLDTAPLRATLAAGVRRRITDGSFGRR
jgi:uncharacterized protein